MSAERTYLNSKLLNMSFQNSGQYVKIPDEIIKSRLQDQESKKQIKVIVWNIYFSNHMNVFFNQSAQPFNFIWSIAWQLVKQGLAR